jgi:hypothetical protein
LIEENKFYKERNKSKNKKKSNSKNQNEEIKNDEK